MFQILDSYLTDKEAAKILKNSNNIFLRALARKFINTKKRSLTDLELFLLHKFAMESLEVSHSNQKPTQKAKRIVDAKTIDVKAVKVRRK
jgi:hypothetical protein